MGFDLATAKPAGFDLSSAKPVGSSKKQAEPDYSPEKIGFLPNVISGTLRGAGSIGATIMTPIDAAARALGIQNEYIGRDDRRQAMDLALQNMGADTNALSFQGGKLGGEIAGTAGAGGVVANSLRAVPAISRAAPGLIRAIETSGAVGSNLPTRVAGGAISGYVQGAMVDPSQANTSAAVGGALPIVGRAVTAGGNAAKRAIGATTGVGEEALTQAMRAGKEGGATGEAFTKAMRGESNMDDVLTAAKQNLQEMGAQKQAAYRQGMQGIKSDKTVLSLTNVDKAVDDALGMATFKGQVKNEKAAQALGQIKSEIENWKSLDPADFHTPEGLDALKQKIGGILEEIPFEQKTARAAAGKVYDSLKAEINKQAPEYASVMKGYSEASDTIKEIEKALSLGQKASADTSMRKLQSLMRNNANTNYGYRNALAQQLEQAGGNELLPSLAGQALNEWTPRGLQRAAAGTGGAGLALTGNIPAAAGLAAISSPRLMGETFYRAGQASNMLSPEVANMLRRGTYTSAPVIIQR